MSRFSVSVPPLDEPIPHEEIAVCPHGTEYDPDGWRGEWCVTCETYDTQKCAECGVFRCDHKGEVRDRPDKYQGEESCSEFQEANVITPLSAAINAVTCQSDDARQQLVAAKVRALMHGYDARWSSAAYEPIAVEITLQSELYNIDTGARSRTFKLAGKLDVIAMEHSRRILIDHKSTSEDITDPNSPYWRQLAIEGQVSHYFLLGHLNGHKFDGAMWDVIRKPGIRPSKLSKKEIEQAMFGRYCGRTISRDLLIECQQTGRETLEMYEARLIEDCTTIRPEWYFQRRGVTCMDGDIHEYATELWDLSQEIIITRRENRHTRNSGACMMYGGPCRYLGVCSGYDEITSDNWTRKEQVHNELQLDGDGRDVLTTSRLRMFQSCKRRHFYSYEMGVERLDEEEKEALYFGTAWHQAQEAWWLTLKAQYEQENNVNTDNSASVAAIDTANQTLLAL